MSTSTTYRPVELTAEQKAEIAARAYRERVRKELMPVLRAQLHESAVSVVRDSIATASTLAALPARAETANTIEELRSLALALGRIEATGDAGAERAGLRFDIARLGLELASLRRTAGELALELPGLEAAERDLAVAEELSATVSIPTASAGVKSLAAAVGRLDEEVNAALARAECSARTVAAATATLAGMGFTTVVQSEDGRVSVLVGQSADGRVAEIEVVAGEDEVELVSRFSDPADAVAPDDPDAGATCEPALADQVRFHRRMGEDSGLRAGTIRTAGRPVRAAPARSAEPPATGRPRRRAVRPPQQRRAR